MMVRGSLVRVLFAGFRRLSPKKPEITTEETVMEYWLEHAAIAMDEAGLTATPEQLDAIAGVIESAHDFYGQAMGQDVASANWHADNERKIRDFAKELRREKDKIFCKECGGNGRIVMGCGLSHTSDSECFKCRGEGRHDP